MKLATFKSGYALLDVTQGRGALERRLKKAGKPVRVLIEATIDYPFGGDDGTSIEFVCSVLSVKEFKR